ncbi:hypothetical protein ACFP65_05165 [Marinilactibacillus sp. GCM10026970]|uniref:hypothetical protein n=1 Tax=Marinilactibacillus sp. GCM10026970 TaxID=3252642 RepID=UPI003614EB14
MDLTTELVTTVSMISGAILYKKLDRTNKINRIAYAIFWYSVILQTATAFLEPVLGNTLGIRVIFIIAMICALVFLAVRIRFINLSKFYKGTTIVLRASLILSFASFCIFLLSA